MKPDNCVCGGTLTLNKTVVSDWQNYAVYTCSYCGSYTRVGQKKEIIECSPRCARCRDIERMMYTP